MWHKFLKLTLHSNRKSAEGNFSANIVLRQCGNRRDVRKFLSFLGCNNDGKEDQDDSDALKRCYCLLENEVCQN